MPAARDCMRVVRQLHPRRSCQDSSKLVYHVKKYLELLARILSTWHEIVRYTFFPQSLYSFITFLHAKVWVCITMSRSLPPFNLLSLRTLYLTQFFTFLFILCYRYCRSVLAVYRVSHSSSLTKTHEKCKGNLHFNAPLKVQWFFIITQLFILYSVFFLFISDSEHYSRESH